MRTIASFRPTPAGHAVPVHVETPRTPDRDELVAALKSDGFDARPIDELGIEVRGGGDLFADLESWIAESGALLVPQPGDGTIYLRPPAS
jgi:hypothetical protein